MKQKYWSNPEFKKSLMLTAIAACFTAAVAVFSFLFITENLKNELIRSNSAAAGILLEKHPEWKEDILNAFASQAGREETEAGLAAAKEYGYNEGLPIRFIPEMKHFATSTVIFVMTLFLGAFLLFVLILYYSHVSFYKRVRETTSAAERIVEGDFSGRLDEGEEGDLAKLAHQFNQMARVLELSIEQLKNEKTYLKNMISDISHQLKTPLSSIKVYNEILQNAAAKDRIAEAPDAENQDVKDPDTEDWTAENPVMKNPYVEAPYIETPDGRRDFLKRTDAQQDFLKRTGEQIERMEWLVKNLLLLARLESGVTEFNYVDAPVSEVLENAVEMLRDKWEAGGIVLTLSVPDKSILFRHDPSWLTEAVSNIVKNSIEHTPAGGHIRISLEDSPLMIRMIFEDNGEGISSTDLPHIFQRFYKGREKTAGSGTGIGLALAKAVVENHGGIISVASKKGSGTTFTITFQK